MRLSVITPSTAALAAPAPDRLDPSNDGGFAAALSGVMQPAAEARPPEKLSTKETEKPVEPKRDVRPAAERQPTDEIEPARQDAAPIDPREKFAVEAIAETTEAAVTETATAADATTIAEDTIPADKDAKPAKPVAAKGRKTTDTEDTATPPAAPMLPRANPAAPLPGQGESQGNGATAAVSAEPSGVIALIGAGDVETDAADMPAADQAPVTDASAPTFQQELARQNGPTSTAKLEAPQPPSAPVAAAPAEQVAVKLATAANGKGDRIRIQLSPEALGKVDVQLDLGEDGQVKAVIRADKPETLHLLMHDAKHLVRGLQDAGFQASANNLQFSLNGDGEQRRQSAFEQAANQSGGHAGNGRGETAAPAESPRIYRSLGRAAHGGIDLSI